MTLELTSGRPVEEALSALAARETALEEELTQVQSELRRLRTAADICPDCGDTGRRRVRGGLYGELQFKACHCRRRSDTGG